MLTMKHKVQVCFCRVTADANLDLWRETMGRGNLGKCSRAAGRPLGSERTLTKEVAYYNVYIL